MSEVLAQPVIEQPAVPAMPEAGLAPDLHNSLSERFLRSRPGMTAVTFIAALGVGGAGELIAPASADAQENPVATASAFHWSNVGGAPLVPGGINSAEQADAFLQSPKGRSALRDEGLNGKEIHAVEKAVEEEGTTPCNIPAGRNLGTMVSADHEVDHNVILDDPDHPNGLKGFCINAVRKFKRNGRLVTQVINEKIAAPCGNALLSGKHEKSRPIRHRRHHVRKAPVFGGKVAKDGANGDVIKPFPTGIFQEEIECKSGNRTIDRKVTMMHPVELLARCNVGSIATISEIVLIGPEDWKAESPTTQRIKVRARGKRRNIATFINRQKVSRKVPVPTTGVTPKDSTPGPGTINTGQEGGAGSGGQPGNPTEGAPCYDDNSSANGDQNPATTDEIMYGTPDQFGVCVGPAQPMQNA